MGFAHARKIRGSGGIYQYGALSENFAFQSKWIEPILGPFVRIRFDVFPDPYQISIIPYDVVVKPSLPGKEIQSVFSAPPGIRRFELADDQR
jgi:hypothetical protein